jgi:cytoskeleton protein RodZ
LRKRLRASARDWSSPRWLPTRTRASYLAALERERFDALPGRACARAFLREYAEHLGLDGQRLPDEYDTRFPDVEEPPLAPARLPQPLRLKP